MEWINLYVAIITTIAVAHYRTTNSTVYVNSTSNPDMVLMVDTDMIYFNKQGFLS
jgi:hypothetical protein